MASDSDDDDNNNAREDGYETIMLWLNAATG